MKKQDLKTGDEIYFTNGAKAIVLLETVNGDVFAGGTYAPLDNYEDDLSRWNGERRIQKICRPNNNYSFTKFEANAPVIWKCTPEKTFSIDGVEYSESTLKSLIKKATE